MELGTKKSGRGEGERYQASLYDLERSMLLSRLQFPVSARNFIEETDEILHVKML